MDDYITTTKQSTTKPCAYFLGYTVTWGEITKVGFTTVSNKQRVLTPGHQGWNDLHSLCRIGMGYYLLNDINNNNNNNNNNDNNNNNNNNNNDDDNE